MDTRTDEFGKIFSENISSYRRLAVSYVHDEQVAEDIVSECFIGLWKHKNEFDGQKGDCRRYIVHAIKNACLQYIRLHDIHDRIRGEISGTDDSMCWPGMDTEESAGPESDLMSGDIEKIVLREVLKMPELTRCIFRDSRLYLMPLAEISRKYGISERRVKWEISKALHGLKSVLKDYLPLCPADRRA